MRVGLSHNKNLSVEDLGLDLHNLTNARLYNVINSRKIVSVADSSGSSDYAIIEFDDNIESPDSDPLAIGLILRDGSYQPHAVWDNRIWSILTEDALAVISAMLGITVEDLAQTANKLINEARRQNHNDSNIQTSAGRPADSDS